MICSGECRVRFIVERPRSAKVTNGVERCGRSRMTASRMNRCAVKRLVVMLLLLVLGGAIVNVAVAWGIVLCARPNLGRMEPLNTQYAHGSDKSGTKWTALHRRGSGWSYIFLTISTETDDTWFETYTSSVGWLPSVQSLPRWSWRPDRIHGASAQAGAFAVGWPMLSLTARFEKRPFGGRQPLSSRSGIVLDLDASTLMFNPPRTLPLLPHWPGFTTNTIFYAAILGVVFFAPGKLRRTIRRRRGLCPACAYPVGTSKVCTECGAKRPLPREGEGRGEGA